MELWKLLHSTLAVATIARNGIEPVVAPNIALRDYSVLDPLLHDIFYVRRMEDTLRHFASPQGIFVLLPGLLVFSISTFCARTPLEMDLSI